MPQNLHRCVIFRGNKVPATPFSAFDSLDPEQLWTYLENARKTGDDVIAVPHNGNASNGLMFDTKTLTGKPITRDYAKRRITNEPLTEIAQARAKATRTRSCLPMTNSQSSSYGDARRLSWSGAFHEGRLYSPSVRCWPGIPAKDWGESIQVWN